MMSLKITECQLPSIQAQLWWMASRSRTWRRCLLFGLNRLTSAVYSEVLVTNYQSSSMGQEYHWEINYAFHRTEPWGTCSKDCAGLVRCQHELSVKWIFDQHNHNIWTPSTSVCRRTLGWRPAIKARSIAALMSPRLLWTSHSCRWGKVKVSNLD